MTYNPDKHHRRSIRLKGYDYNQPGAYFVTLLAHQRESLFGHIKDGIVHLNNWGVLADNEWRRLSQRFPYVEICEFILMPDHLHGILLFTSQQPDTIPALNPASLGAVIGAYKSTTGRLLNGLRRTLGAPVWQRNDYERIIRNEAELRRVAEYIRANPAAWGADQENSARIP